LATGRNAGERRHLLVLDTASIEAYSPRGGGLPFDVPPRNRRRHAAQLLRQFRGIRTDLEGLEAERTRLGFDPEAGLVLQFESLANFPLKFESLDLRSEGIELLTVKENQGRTIATCYVPNGKLDVFIKRVEAYRDEDTLKGKPKNNPLVANIESVQLAAIDALWTDDILRIPRPNVPAWWEIWLRAEDTGALDSVRHAAARIGFTFTEEILHFPERTVVTANCTKRQLGRVLRLTGTIAELREGKTTAADFLRLSPEEQYQLADGFLAQVTVSDTTNAVACILDTGATQGHSLLQPALAAQDCYSVQDAWGVDDQEGHGTEMAGISLYGDIAPILTAGTTIELEHRLESVKILNPGDPNPPHLYGAITARAAALVEQANPLRQRVFAMAVTANGDENGEPSTWSAAVDAITSGYGDERKRLMLISAGNSNQTGWHVHPGSCLTSSVQDPAQAWNAISIGASTQMNALPSGKYPGWTVVATPGDVSPYSSTSAMWNHSWPIKPDVVFEGGNCAIDPATASATEIDELSLLTTHGRPTDRPFSLIWATSAATAIGCRFATTLQARYPEYWPETIRGLTVHSAEWTAVMMNHFQPIATRERTAQLLRYCGYGEPNLAKACWSANNALTLVAQDELQPYHKDGSAYKTKDIAIHTLPWPAAVLRDLSDLEVELRVTLSYFVEPNPGRRGWSGRYRYASHGLRFDVKTALETVQEFRQRIRSVARTEDDSQQLASDSQRWAIGPQLRHRGSVHSDTWRGTAVELAEKNMIAIYPVVGWWRERHHLNRWSSKARYSLIVTLRTPTEDVDIYTPVANMIGVQIETEDSSDE